MNKANSLQKAVIQWMKKCLIFNLVKNKQQQQNKAHTQKEK